jgi:hypothetical protein
MRTNLIYRKKERENDRQRKQLIRSTKDNTKQKILDRERHIELRKNSQYRTQEKERDKISKRNARTLSKEDIYSEYELQIREGPCEICSSCNGLWFKRSMRKINISKDSVQQSIKLMFKDQDFINNFCTTCASSISKGKIPRLYIGHGLEFPNIPEPLIGLSELEERLVSPRIPFMQIRPLGVDLQKGLKGAVVNVPIDIDTNVSVIPRNINEHHTIAVSLMRKMEYKNPYIYEVVRPNKILAAAKYLCKTPLYKEHQIGISKIWSLKDQNTYIDEDSSSEQDQENILNPGGLQTMICCEDNFNVKFAPGEGKTPISMLYDTDSEELSFPSIYCGHKRNTPNFISYNDIAKSEARRSDRRCCNVTKMFYTYKKMELLRLKNNISLFCRQTKTGFKSLTARDILDENSVETLIRNDNAFKLLQNVRASPPFWQEKKKEVMSMIRQLGIPTLFMTLSAAESQWPELIKILYKILNKQDITLEQANELPWNEKAKLIQSDPITCSRYFDNRIRTLIYKVLMKENGPFKDNKIIDYYYRIEFQHRGSPHVHCIFWLDNAPKYIRGESNKLVIDFINKHINTDKEQSEFSKYQIHKHTSTCYNCKSNKCRFGIPFPPMDKTVILEPLNENQNKTHYEKIYEEIDKELNKKDFIETYSSLHEFLKKIQITEETYILALRSKLKNPKVFLKREVKDIFVNPFNKEILDLHRANMDIQFILDPYACISYIVNYVAKSQRGMSMLLRNIIEKSREGKISIKEQLKMVANTFVNCSEVSAQEVAYHILAIPMSVSSRANMFINTSRPNERVRLVKPRKDLEEMNEESNDIYVSNMIDYYTNRPYSLENICLAEFCAWYTYKTNKLSVEDDNITDDSENTEENKTIKLLNCKGYIVKRTKSKVIRYRRFNEEQDPIEYYREMLMLFYHWRNEMSELVEINHKKKYEENINIINSNRSTYIKEQIDEDIEEVNETIETEISNTKVDKINVIQNIAKHSTNKTENFSLPNQLSSSDYKELIENLNTKQSYYHSHFLEKISSNKTFYEFVTGPAGVGKSMLINAIYQSSIRHYNSIAGSNPDKMKVLLSAPTGRAAFSIGGITLHGALHLPISQCSHELIPMSSNICNSLRCKLNELKLIIIDEVSMVGAKTFSHVDSRLRQIFNSNKIFGGISLIVFGDLRQLRPVCDRYVFQNDPTNPYSELIDNRLWSPFKMFQLTEIMRQKDDKIFAEALQRISLGKTTKDDDLLFESRTVSNVDLIPKKAVHLYVSNKEVDCHNSKIINSREGKCHISTAYDQCTGDAPKSAKDHILKKVKELEIQKTSGLRTNLVLKVGIKYMITCNINVSDGLVNGAIGTLHDITYDNQGMVSLAWIKFDKKSIGKEQRKKYPDKILDNNPLTPITRDSRNIDHTSKLHNIQVIRKQFPLTPAEAITIHKSQGETLQQVAVHLAPRMTRSCLYVALSRATNIKGLYLVGKYKSPAAPLSNDIIENEYNRLLKDELIPCSTNIETKLATETLLNNNKYILPQLIESDYLILENNSTQYFTDIIIDNYLVHLQTISNKRIFAISSNYFINLQSKEFKKATENDMYNHIRFLDYAILLYPICMDSHWVLVSVDIQSSTIIFHDSLIGYLSKAKIEYIIRTVKKSLPESTYKIIILSDIYQQENGYDCGLFLCTFAKEISTGQIGILSRHCIKNSLVT